MKIHRISITHEQWDHIPSPERAFYIHMGHLRHELMVLKKLLELSAKKTPTDPILRDVHLSQQFIIGRLLAGKIREGWELIKKAYFGTKLSLGIEKELPDDTTMALKNLKKYFGTKNLIDCVRNEFAFHYDTERVQSQVLLVEQPDNLKIYIAETEDVFFHLSDMIVQNAMLEAVQPGDYLAAAETFFKEIMIVSGQLVDFCDGCLHYMIEQYISYGGSEQFEVPDPPNCDDLRLSFFCK